MNNKLQTKQANPISIRQRLIRYLLIGLPLLFLLISLAVSLPLYKQLLAEEDESMKQFAHVMLTPPDIKGILNDVIHNMSASCSNHDCCVLPNTRLVFNQTTF